MNINSLSWMPVAAAVILAATAGCAGKKGFQSGSVDALEFPPDSDARTVELGGGVKLALVWIPPGEFLMGSSFDEEGRMPFEGFRHQVRLTRGFWMGKYSVTQEQWEQVMGNNPSYFKGRQLPVDQVNWADCQNFVRSLNRLLKTSHLKAALPTEAQWEYACRAGTRTRFYTGDSDADLARAGWFFGNSGLKPHEVGRKHKNNWGLYDMHGNVWQWCQDWIEDYPHGLVTDPTGPVSGKERCLRGGSWGSDSDVCRAACRFYYPPDSRLITAGLRIVAVAR